MGLLDIFRRGPRRKKQALMLSGFSPFFGQNGVDIYASDVVQQAIKCIVDELKKLQPKHIVQKANEDPVPKVDSTLQRVLDDPNPVMTTSEFIEKTAWLLLLNYNAFIIPTYYRWKDPDTGEERRQYAALYPIQPLTVDFIEDEAGKLFCTFTFPNGYETTIDYEDVIHIRYNYSVSEYMGGDKSGNPDHRGILETLKLNDTLLKGLAKSLKASYSVNGIFKYNTQLDDGAMEENLRKFEQKLNNNESGFLPIDLKADFTPLEHKGALIDEPTLKFLDEKILRNWGVSLPILTGDYTKDQFEAFFQKACEPIIVSFGQAFTKKLFTPRERGGYGNKVVFYPKNLVFLSIAQTIEAIQVLAPTGGMTENEKRTALGLPPLPELVGKRYMSLNWIDASQAAAYQAGAAANEQVEVIDEDREDM